MLAFKMSEQTEEGNEAVSKIKYNIKLEYLR